MIDRVHHVGVVLPRADDALGFYRDVLGLEVTADEVIEEQGVRGVLLQVGENEIELLEPVRDDTGVARFLESRGPTLHHICFNTDDIAGELDRLRGLEVQLIDEQPRRGLAGQVAFIHPKAMHGVLVELAQAPPDAHVSPAKGFDHLVARVADPEEAAATWERVIGLQVANTLRLEDRGIVVHQLPSGQCTLELVSATGPESPVAKQIAEEGERAVSVVAIEVPDLDSAISTYRQRGAVLPDPAPGALPNSRTSTISAEQGYGLAIQLIEFRR